MSLPPIPLAQLFRAATLAVGICASTTVPAKAFADRDGEFTQTGIASRYNASRYYANNGRTMAHRTLPKGAYAIVTNLANGKSTCVKKTDVGPFAPHRIVDLSHEAADDIGLSARKGLTHVKVQKVVHC